ncbi:hypothetical protein ACG7YL_002773 [Enterococcus hirae]|uniref:hypothetical protein n=1 Tax=Bacteria TaxID=2 RepID=UPI000330D34F|nr:MULTISPECIES: hypothetical protein [Bacteria]EMF0154909.1 hypothetical protein [Enterococcus hirae]EGW0027154.1 hypothetical protein [Enterococcus faecium]EME7093669.1 hypothetical protein [Enterococcus faecium]EMF0236343.1 hypothetical protein [Enterococcus hirae]EOL03037.1 hypothetical protein SIW_02767 [Enterococcus faecium EnGen0158]
MEELILLAMLLQEKKREREAEQLERIRIGYEEADRERDQKIEELEKRIQELSKNYDNNQDWEQEWRKIIGIKENEYLVRKPPEEEEDPWSDF